jgi:hypothetical protein
MGYSRILLSDGAELSHTDGVLDVGVASMANANHDDFQVNANLQISNSDVAEGNPVHVALVSPTTLAVTDNNGSLTVDATDLDIRALDYSTDAVKSLPQLNSDTLVGNSSMSENTGTSSLDCIYCRHISVAGSVDGAVTLEFQVSDDDTVWFGTGSQIIVPEAGSFHANFETSFRYVRLIPDANVTTATIIMTCSG